MKILKRTVFLSLAALTIGLSVDANAANIDEVDSQVYTATGTRQQILARAAVCVAQVMRPGIPNAPLILSRDNTAGVLVIDNYTHFSARLVTWALHTTMTLEAKNGRFRIVHTGIEQTADPQGPMSAHPSWVPVSKGFPNPWKHAQQAIEDVSTRLANCVTRAPKPSDW